MSGLAWGAATDTGRVRTANEDSILAVAPVFAVADGMGGHAAGEVASGLAVAAVSRVVPAGSHPTLAGLVAAVQAANQAIHDRAGQDLVLRGMGTTLCAIARLAPTDDGEPRLAIVNVGDSRVYALHDHQLSQVSRDHSFVEDLVAAGEITPEEARFHPQRNVVTRALGIDRYVEVDTWELTVRAGDRFLLCSDGLSNEVADATIEELLNSTTDPQAVADELVRRANAHGGRDNVSVVIVDVLADGTELGVIVRAPDWATIEEATVTTGRADLASPTMGTQTHDGQGTVGGAASGPGKPSWMTTGPMGAGADLAEGGRTGSTTAGGTSSPTGTGRSGPGTGESLTVPTPAVAASLAAADVKARRRRIRMRVRAAVFVAAILAVFGVALASVQAYGQAGWYVGFRGNDVALYQGRRAGLLWVKPRLVATLGTTRSDLTPTWQQRIDATISFTSQAAAKSWHGALKQNPAAVPNQPTIPTVPASTTSTTTASTTTLAGPTVVVLPPGQTCPTLDPTKPTTVPAPCVVATTATTVTVATP